MIEPPAVRRRRCRLACLLVAVLAAAAPPAGALEVTLDAVPGGIVEVPLAPLGQPRPQASFGQRQILVTRFGPNWVGLVGLPLNLVPGEYIIQVHATEQDESAVHAFRVFPRRTRRPAVVELPDTPTARERIELGWRGELDARFPLASPVPGPARPLFGRYRQVSETRSEHIDFVAFDIAGDTPVTAPGNGRVAAVTSEEAGLFVWIDHGMSLYSCVGPVTRTARREGDGIEAGQAVGRVELDDEDTPRSLYWSVFLNGTAVDPFLLSPLRPAPRGD